MPNADTSAEESKHNARGWVFDLDTPVEELTTAGVRRRAAARGAIDLLDDIVTEKEETLVWVIAGLTYVGARWDTAEGQTQEERDATKEWARQNSKPLAESRKNKRDQEALLSVNVNVRVNT